MGGASNDLIAVTAGLTLDGILNVTNSASFGLGTYRLINFGGGLTNNGLGIGTTPAGFSASDLTIQTSVANQVNRILCAHDFNSGNVAKMVRLVDQHPHAATSTRSPAPPRP